MSIIGSFPRAASKSKNGPSNSNLRSVNFEDSRYVTSCPSEFLTVVWTNMNNPFSISVWSASDSLAEIITRKNNPNKTKTDFT